MNLRADDSFLEDEGWRQASEAYHDFLQENKNKRVLFLELGVGINTPVIIKYHFWYMTKENKKARYVCINRGEAFYPMEIEDRSLAIDEDIDKVLDKIL